MAAASKRCSSRRTSPRRTRRDSIRKTTKAGVSERKPRLCASRGSCWFDSKLIAKRGLLHAPPYLSFRSCPKRKTAPRPGLRVAAAGGRRRRPGISAAAPLAGCREPLSPSVRTGDFPQGGKHNGPQRAMRQGGGRKKRALRAIDSSIYDTQYARLPNLGADCIQVGNLFAPVSAEGFAYARAAAGKDRRGRCPHRPAFGSCIGSIWGSTPTDISPGRIQRGAAAPLCVVSK